MLGGGGDAAPAAGDAGSLVVPPLVLVCQAQQGQGLQISAAMVNKGGALAMEMEVSNQSQAPVQNLAVQLNKSSFGITPQNAAITFAQPIMPGATGAHSVPLTVTPGMLAPGAVNTVLQVAIKNMHTNAVFYYQLNYSLHVLLKSSGMDSPTFQQRWGQVDPATTATSTATDLAVPATSDAVAGKLARYGLAVAVNVPAGPDGVSRTYFSASSLTNVVAMLEIAFKAGFNGVKVSVRTSQPQFAEAFKTLVETALRTP